MTLVHYLLLLLLCLDALRGYNVKSKKKKKVKQLNIHIVL